MIFNGLTHTQSIYRQTGRLGLFWLLSVLWFWGLCFPAWADSSSTNNLDLSQFEWSYRIGDDLDWKSPDYDDSKWSKINLPGKLPEKISLGEPSVVWYRVTIPSNQLPNHQRMLVYLGRISNEDETYANGKKIGFTGKIWNSARDYHGMATSVVNRVYALPRTIIDNHQAITLAIRVQGVMVAIGPVQGPLLIGDEFTLRTQAQKADEIFWMRAGIWVALFIVAFLISAVSVYSKGRDKRHIWMPPFLGLLALAIVPATLLGVEWGISTPWMFIISSRFPYTIFGFLYVSRVLSTPLTKIQWSCLLIAYVSTPAIFIFDAKGQYILLADLLGITLVGVAILILLAQGINAYRRGYLVSKWIYIGLLCITLTTFFTALLPREINYLYSPAELGFLILVICMLIAMFNDHRHDRLALNKVTRELMKVQETERNRLAAELHDGISQHIAIIRFRLERLRGRTDMNIKDQLQKPIDELSAAGKELSALVQTLKPAALEQASFAEALNFTIERWNLISETRIVSELDDGQPSKQSQAQLFRIIQEAVHNAIRHAQANQIIIRLSLDKHENTLTIIDDGIGFKPNQCKHGFGLKTMIERSELIGGHLYINSSKGMGTGMGTEIKVVVPSVY